MVYSTCSMNPVENEAVISAALREYGADPGRGKKGRLSIVDTADYLPNLKRTHGLTTWRVCPGLGKHLRKKAPDAAAQKESTSVKTGADEVQAQAPLNFDATKLAKHDDDDALANGVASAPEIETEIKGEASGEAEVDGPDFGSEAYRNDLPNISWVDSYESLAASDASLAARTPLTLWPCGQEKEMGLQNCMRFYPHFQNTGGFFVAVLEMAKVGSEEDEGISLGMARAMDALDSDAAATVSEVVADAAGTGKRTASQGPEEPDAKRVKSEVDESEVKVENDQEIPRDDPNAHIKPDNHAAARAQKERGRKHENDSGHGLPGGTPFKEDPYTYVDPVNSQIVALFKQFGFSDALPRRNFLVRNTQGEPLRSMYTTSTSVRALINGGGPGREGFNFLNALKLRVINVGIKTIGRQDAGKDPNLECKWRVMNDGTLVLRPFAAPETVARGSASDLAFMLANHYPTIASLPASNPFFEDLRTRKIGSFFADFEPSEHEGRKIESVLSFPIWRAPASVNLMLDKQDRR